MPRGPAPAAVALLAPVVFAGGCAHYRPVPLDVAAHRARFDARLDDLEPITAFVARLEASRDDVPDRFDPSDGLTIAEGEVAALFWNADLRLARLRAGIAAVTAEYAGRWEDPVFRFDGAELLSPSGPFEYGLQLEFTLPVSGRLEVEKDRASAARDVELHRVAELEWRTRAEVRAAWARWSAEVERVRLERELLGQVERIRAITDQLEDAGELSRVEARLFVVEELTLRERLVAAESAVRRARLELLALLGLPAASDVELRPALAPLDVTGADDDLDRALIAGNPRLAVRRVEYRVAEDTVRFEVRRQFPDITIGGGAGSEDDDRLLLGLSIPIPILSGNRAAIAEARAGRDLARASAETTYERLSADLAAAVEDRRAVRARLDILESQVLPLLDAQAREIDRIVELGEVDTLLLLESVKRQFDLRMTLLDLQAERAAAAARIVALVGPPASPAGPVPDDAATVAAGVQP